MRLSEGVRFNIPWDDQTEGGQQLVCRLEVPAGTDRRRVKRELRKTFLAMGERNYNRAIKAMGFSEYV